MDLYRTREPYISITVKGRYLKRIEFRIWSGTSNDTSIHEACRNSYRRPYSWTEAIVQRPTSGPLTTALQPRQIQVDIHDSDTPRHHSVIWDIRDLTPGVKEWLESIQDGDVIAVHLRRFFGPWRKCVLGIEVDAYCGV
ncbi:hypothetical protein BDD12DRAFT_845288 [Trichophaea hybrida]|nr:hypothetical protein BDD12DRAFT_845288 [Trichophaea hybrida]